jgi:hypothetical protein
MRSLLASALLTAPHVGSAQLGWPADIESLLAQYVSAREVADFTDVEARCGATECFVTFGGPMREDGRIAPAFATAVVADLYKQGWRVMTSFLSTQTTAAGTREYLLTVTNIPRVE